jgi:hypothetical protein
VYDDDPCDWEEFIRSRPFHVTLMLHDLYRSLGDRVQPRNLADPVPEINHAAVISTS